MDRYYLDENNNPVRCESLMDWHTHFESSRLKTQQVNEFSFEGEYIRISTVFLGIDHAYGIHDGVTPILFETMVFGGPDQIDEMMERYATYEQALIGHKAYVDMVREYIETHKPPELLGQALKYKRKLILD